MVGRAVPKKPIRILAGLFVISASSFIFEIILTKFFSYKMYHHYVFALVAIVLLGFMFGGLTIFLFHKRIISCGPLLQKASWYFGLSALIVIPIFCWIPADPYYPGVRGALSLPFFFFLFFIPFYFSGLAISALFAETHWNIGVIYFFDLIGAAIGCWFSPFLLDVLGGYGTVISVAWLSFLASWLFGRRLFPIKPMQLCLPIVLSVVVALYPGFMRSRHSFDISTMKHYWAHLAPFQKEFGGITQTYWNAIGRIDVSDVGDSLEAAFRYGIPGKYNAQSILGRLILQDGAAPTRQILNLGNLSTQKWLSDTFWAAPYVMRKEPVQRSMIIGVGGGIEILVAKRFEVLGVDAVEINPDTYEILKGHPNDADAERYIRWIRTDRRTTVNLYNCEARHFCSTRPDATYDIIVASGVDTRAAILTGGNTLTENFLYTVEAMQDYYRLLKPGGYLALSMWGSDRNVHIWRMFNTALLMLEMEGVEMPAQNICVLRSDDNVYFTTIVKKGAYGEEEIERLKEWSKGNDFKLVFNPFETVENSFYGALAFSDSRERSQLIRDYPQHISPTTDDWPFFYLLEKFDPSRLRGWFHGLFPVKGLFLLFILVILIVIGAMIYPALYLKRTEKILPSFQYIIFFSLCGCAFILVENVLFLKLSVFVGGSFYALVIILPGLLSGYGISSLISARYIPNVQVARLFILLGFVISFTFLYAVFTGNIPLPLHFNLGHRLLIALALSIGTGLVLGIPVPWCMDMIKQQYPHAVALMWGLNSGWNVIGSLAFHPLALVFSISGVMLIAMGLYLLALVIMPFIALKKWKPIK